MLLRLTELAVPGSCQEGCPLVGGEDQRWPVRVLAVANGHLVGNEGNLHAVTVRAAEAAGAPLGAGEIDFLLRYPALLSLRACKYTSDQIACRFRADTLMSDILADAGIQTVLTGIRAPRMNSIMERWVQLCRRELLDRCLLWNERHLRNALRE